MFLYSKRELDRDIGGSSRIVERLYGQNASKHGRKRTRKIAIKTSQKAIIVAKKVHGMKNTSDLKED